jgi:hypothetical protein
MKKLSIVTVVVAMLALLGIAAQAQKQMKVKAKPAAFSVEGLDYLEARPSETIKRHIRIKGGTPPYTCSLSNAPTWLSAQVAPDTPNYCEISGTAPSDFSGEVTFTLNVTDSLNATPVFQ